MRIAIAADHAGFALKERVKLYLKKRGFQVKDLGVYSDEHCDYPAISYALAREVSKKAYNRGILVCKTGIGHSIVANRLAGIRAALCYNVKAARFSREHNDSNILVLGSAFVSLRLAKRITGTWLAGEFKGGRHRRRLNQIKKIEEEIMRKVR